MEAVRRGVQFSSVRRGPRGSWGQTPHATGPGTSTNPNRALKSGATIIMAAMAFLAAGFGVIPLRLGGRDGHLEQLLDHGSLPNFAVAGSDTASPHSDIPANASNVTQQTLSDDSASRQPSVLQMSTLGYPYMHLRLPRRGPKSGSALRMAVEATAPRRFSNRAIVTAVMLILFLVFLIIGLYLAFVRSRRDIKERYLAEAEAVAVEHSS